MDATIVLLPGDGIGPEIVAATEMVLSDVADRYAHRFSYDRRLIGGIAIDETGVPLPEETLAACQQADAVLLGAVGGPKWDDPTAPVRPEQGLLAIRKELGLFANLRPIRPAEALRAAAPLREEIIAGTDILFVRELTGGIYFGASGRREIDGEPAAFSEMVYRVSEIERIVRFAARAARERGGKLTSVDKANVLEVSRLWREVTTRLMREEFPEVTLEHVLVDAMAMHLIARPSEFDVVVTGNLFGDILTDAASMLPGSLGLLPSASLGSDGPGLFEPIHGSAPEIAGQGIANPLATILAAAMLLRHSLGLEVEAAAVEGAVEAVLAAGHRTRDIATTSEAIGTEAMGRLVAEALA